MRAVLMIVVAISAIASGLAIGELASGFGEVLRHWWSALPLIAFAGSAGALVLVERRRQRS